MAVERNTDSENEIVREDKDSEEPLMSDEVLDDDLEIEKDLEDLPL